tara:strand:- start:764 stop:970 length:207 start_codon:yes stop_codon:yes gene_type:complete
MASDNDWYSDESDETFRRNKEGEMYSKLVELHNSICSYEACGEEVPDRWIKELDKLKKEFKEYSGCDF